MAQARRNYSEIEMQRMQQEAVERVREMQNRARQAVQDSGEAAYPQQDRANRNWSTNPNVQRQRQQQQRQHSNTPRQPSPPPQKEQVKPDPPPPPPDPVEKPEAGKKSTLIQDILGGIGLDSDRMLIIGLLFILINEKADTTLILALMYLLI